MNSIELPDILFITVDALRRDRMAPYGRNLMPTVAHLLKEGVAFDRCMATAPWTGASVASMFTGLWPRQHGFLANRPREGWGQTCSSLRSDVRVLAEILQDAGYHTMCAQGNCGFLIPQFGVHRGFREYAVWDKWWWRGTAREEMRALVHALRYEGISRYVRFTRHRVARRFRLCRLPRRLPMQDGETLVRVALRMLGRAPCETPVFLWVNFMETHDPYWVPRKWEPDPGSIREVRPVHLRPHLYPDDDLPENEKLYVRRRYDATVRYVDYCINKLLRSWQLVRRKRSRLTLFTSDHGEEFWEHGDNRRDPLYYSRGVAHGHTLFNELLRVPLINGRRTRGLEHVTFEGRIGRGTH